MSSWRSNLRKAVALLALAPLALAASTAIAQSANSPAPNASGSALHAQRKRHDKDTPPAYLAGSATPVEAVGPAASATIELPPQPPPRRGRRAAKPDLRPVVSTPAFQMLPDGSSRLEVSVVGKPLVQQFITAGAVVYVFQDCHVPVHNNRNPLVTRFFNTPIADARLRQVGKDVHLIVDLRTQAAPSAHVVQMVPNRVLALQIDFAPGSYWLEPEIDPATGTRRVRDAASPSRGTTRSPSSPAGTNAGSNVLGPPAP